MMQWSGSNLWPLSHHSRRFGCWCWGRTAAPPSGPDPADGVLSDGSQAVRPALPGAAAAPQHDHQGRAPHPALLCRWALRAPGRLHQAVRWGQRRPQVCGDRRSGPRCDPDLWTLCGVQGGQGGWLAHLWFWKSAEAEAGAPADEEEALLLWKSRDPRVQLVVDGGLQSFQSIVNVRLCTLWGFCFDLL